MQSAPVRRRPHRVEPRRGCTGRDALPGSRRRRLARRRAGLALGLVAGAVAAGAAPALPRLHWSEARGFHALGAVTAVAVDRRGRVAVGTDRGVWLRVDGRAPRLVLHAAGVHDLAFTGRGRLLVASERGVDRVAADGSVVRASPGPGAARHVQRLLAMHGGILAAAESGLFFSRAGRVWQKLDGSLPRGSVVALARSGPGTDLFLVLDGDLYRLALREGAAGPSVASAERLSLPEAEGAVVDVAAAPGSRGVYALGPRSLSLVSGAQVRSRRLALPPGARAQRIAVGEGGLWIATDRGLVEVPGMRGAVTRVAGPPAGAPVAALALSEGALFAGGSRGLWVGRSAPPHAPPAASHGPERLREPGIVEVQQAALRYVDLGPERMRALRRGVDRRGWLPTLELGGGWGDDRSSGWSADETFTYGSLHHLQGFDGGRKRSFDVEASLKWNLGDLAYNADAVDVSKETRAVIELRDEVLDQVDQLYYERRRVLLELSSFSDPLAPEARRLRIRAEELGAGLDAWTGGWWSRRLAALRDPSPPGPDPRTMP